MNIFQSCRDVYLFYKKKYTMNHGLEPGPKESVPQEK